MARIAVCTFDQHAGELPRLSPVAPLHGLEAFVQVGRLRGSAIALGRFQRAASAIDLARVHERGERVVRRSVGGPALGVGDGQLHLLLQLASPASLGGIAEPERALNRHVRPLLGVLERLGVRATYGGRDVVTGPGGAPIAWIGVGHRRDTGAVTLEAIVSVGAPFTLDPALDLAAGAIAPRFRGRAPATLNELLGRALDEAQLVGAVVDAYVAQAGGERTQLSLTLAPAPIDLEEPPFTAMVEEAIGLVGARHEPEHGRVALGGDLGASEDALAALERALFAAGRDATEEQLGALVDAHLGPASGAIVFGVKSLRALAKAAHHALRAG